MFVESSPNVRTVNVVAACVERKSGVRVLSDWKDSRAKPNCTDRIDLEEEWREREERESGKNFDMLRLFGQTTLFDVL